MMDFRLLTTLPRSIRVMVPGEISWIGTAYSCDFLGRTSPVRIIESLSLGPRHRSPNAGELTGPKYNHALRRGERHDERTSHGIGVDGAVVKWKHRLDETTQTGRKLFSDACGLIQDTSVSKQQGRLCDDECIERQSFQRLFQFAFNLIVEDA
ncbi:hypothetical protein VL15_38730 [Burkholderia cepacia]|uniref:Uncharacterized protein n=1 Tax=Burkholderia cepacia TaxID=292 RepID=A0A0J5VKT9_BURCE|nr:hypothetical protein VL15_38730 [Burkholderia cepacia]